MRIFLKLWHCQHFDITTFFAGFKTIILCCVLCNSWNMCFLLKQITRTLNWTQHDCVDLMWDDNLQHLCQFLLMKIMFYIAVSYSWCPSISYYALVNYFFSGKQDSSSFFLLSSLNHSFFMIVTVLLREIILHV